jgi:ABC-type amino acid transport substrate-binding protein
VAVRAGSSNEKYARQIFSKAEIKLIVSEVQPATLMELATGRVDAAVIAVMSAANVIENNPNIKGITRVGDLIAPSQIAWAMPKGEYHFLHFVNTFLKDMETSGEMEQLRAKWLTN